MNIIQTTEVFDKWFDALKDHLVKSKVKARIRRAELGNFGDCESVGKGVSGC